MTNPNQRSSRAHASTISNEAALVGALAAFSKSPSTSPNAPKTGPLIGINPRRVVSHGSVSSTTISPGSAYGTLLTGNAIPSFKRPALPNKQNSSASIDVRTNPRPSRPIPRTYQSSSAVPNTRSVQRITPKKNVVAMRNGAEGPDETRIPSTSSLVEMFEGKDNKKEPGNPTITVHSPRPTPRSLLTNEISKTTEDTVVPDSLSKVLSDSYVAERTSSPDSFVSATNSVVHHETPDIETLAPDMLPSPIKVKQPAPPSRRRPAKSRSRSPKSKSVLQSTESLPLHTQPIPIRRGSGQGGPYSMPSAALSSQSITAQYHQLHPRRMSALKTGDSLANALVASSLASSRAPSPSAHSAPIPHRNSRSSHHSLFKSRTPSPTKRATLRQTLRKQSTSTSSSDSEGDPYSKHKKKRHIRKHPNKHHEGDRKRWRNAVTERERKRYEGLWAANRGIACTFTADEENAIASSYTGAGNEESAQKIRDSAAEQVSDLVVKDIWIRSRLPAHVLAEVWELVDGQGVRRLTREEFVVGLWLIDQRLKGRKLPLRVSESVWNSVKFLQGIKIRKK